MQASVVNSFRGPTPGLSFDSAYNSVRSAVSSGWSYVRAPVKNLAYRSDQLVRYGQKYRGIPFVGEVVDWALTNPLADEVFGFIRSVDEELDRIERVARDLETFFELGSDPDPEDAILREWIEHPLGVETPQGNDVEGHPNRQHNKTNPAETGGNHAGGSLDPNRIYPGTKDHDKDHNGVPLPPDDMSNRFPNPPEDKTPHKTDRPEPQPTNNPIVDPYMPRQRTPEEQKEYDKWVEANQRESLERQKALDQWLQGTVSQKGSAHHGRREKKQHHDNDYNPLLPGLGNLPLIPLG